MPNVHNENLSSTQQEALDAYRKHVERHGEPPTVRQLAEHLGKSHNAAHYLIQKLREKGYLSMKPITIIRPSLTAKARRTK